MEKLIKIQKELKAPKNQYNSFGNYKYRSAEDILEAVKPLLHENGLFITISDDIVNIGARIYVKSTITIYDNEKSLSTVAFARESEQKKGMDESQITGAASSYARKYALNGMFCIDDQKDSDVTNNKSHNKSDNEKPKDDNKPWLNQNSEQWNKAVEYIKGGGSIDEIKKKYKLSKENYKLLNEQV